jgi:hypothetical protein
MKKLHLAASTDNLRPQLQHIQVKNNFVYSTNCHILVKIPVNEVFGEDIIQNNEELYFPALQWKKQNFYKALTIIRTENIFKAYDHKMNLLGIIEAVTLTDFIEKIGRFPDCENVIPTGEIQQIDQLSINPDLYKNLIDVFNLDVPLFKMKFYGTTKPVVIENFKDQTAGIGIIMPIDFNH